MQNIGNILFVIAGLLWGIELIPQLAKTIRTKKVGDISLFFLTLCFLAYITFLVGCYFIQNWFLLFAHIIPFVNVCILLYLVSKYRHPTDRMRYFYRKKVKELQKTLPPDNKAQSAYIKKECSGECDTCPYRI